VQAPIKEQLEGKLIEVNAAAFDELFARSSNQNRGLAQYGTGIQNRDLSTPYPTVTSPLLRSSAVHDQFLNFVDDIIKRKKQEQETLERKQREVCLLQDLALM